jgi:hypothetical protein
MLVAFLGVFPTTAHAITRTDVLLRAHNWVAKKVRYSQHASFGGYRRDCSGFVSMAWKLSRSYTSSTIQAVAKRVPISQLRPGDAVHTPGHVAIFVKWANRARTRYVAMEESQPGRPALHHVRSLGSHATGLRYRRIADPPVIVAAAAPLTGVSPTAPASATSTSSADATAAAAPVTSTVTTATLLAADAAPTRLFTSALQPTGLLALVPISY